MLTDFRRCDLDLLFESFLVGGQSSTEFHGKHK